MRAGTRREEVLSWKSQCPPFSYVISASENDLSELRGGDGRMGSLSPFLPVVGSVNGKSSFWSLP